MRKIVQKFSDHIAYYNVLSEQMIDCHVPFGGDKFRVEASNAEELMRKLDDLSTLTKQNLVVAYHLLLTHQRQTAIVSRKRKAEERNGNRDDNNDTSLRVVGGDDENKSNTSDDEDMDDKKPEMNSLQISTKQQHNDNTVSRIDRIPKFLLNAKSRCLKLALMIYLTGNLSDNLRLSFLYQLCCKPPKTKVSTMNVHELLGLLKDNGVLRKTLDSFEPPTQMQFMLVSALMEMAHIAHEPKLSRMAMSINFDMYHSILMKSVAEKGVNKLYMLEPLLSLYLKRCVAPTEIQQHRAKLKNQFEVDPVGVVRRLTEPETLAKLFKQKQSEHSVDGNGKDKAKKMRNNDYLDPEQVYEVYHMEPNHASQIKWRTINTDTAMMQVEMYKYTIVDVIGVAPLNSKTVSPSAINNVAKLYEDAGYASANGLGSSSPIPLEDGKSPEKGIMNGLANNESNMSPDAALVPGFLTCRMKWSDRLKLVGRNPVIMLSEKTGQEINNYKGSGDFLVAYTDRDGNRLRMLIKKRDRQATSTIVSSISPSS